MTRIYALLGGAAVLALLLGVVAWQRAQIQALSAEAAQYRAAVQAQEQTIAQLRAETARRDRVLAELERQRAALTDQARRARAQLQEADHDATARDFLALHLPDAVIRLLSPAGGAHPGGDPAPPGPAGP